MVLFEKSASLIGLGMVGLQAAYAQEKGACVEASGVAGGSSAQVNAAPEEAYAVTFGLFEKVGDSAADVLQDTSLRSQAEDGREEGQIQAPVEGSLRQESGLVVHLEVLGRTGAH